MNKSWSNLVLALIVFSALGLRIWYEVREKERVKSLENEVIRLQEENSQIKAELDAWPASFPYIQPPISEVCTRWFFSTDLAKTRDRMCGKRKK